MAGSGTRPPIVIIGSGINALVAAALLGKAGRRVVVLEREAEAGGCIKSAELISPGFVHDIMAATFVLFLVSPGYARLAGDLERHGLEFCHSDHPTAVLRPDGSARILGRDRAANQSGFAEAAAGDGAAYGAALGEVEQNAELIFALLGQPLMSRQMGWMLARQIWKQGLNPLKSFFGRQLGSARHWLETAFEDETNRALLAPWVLHTGLGPESSFSGAMARIIAFTLEAAGAPIVKGGASKAVDAFAGLIAEQGGEIRTGADVAEIIVAGGRARAVRLADGEEIAASEVIASVTPTQLYTRLLASPSDEAREQTAAYRYGKGNFQLHYTLDAPPKWNSAGLEKVALIHLSDGLDAVSRACNEAERGLLPAVPTICVGQPTALDPSRAPAGKAILWLQMPEAPRHIKADAAGQIKTPADGSWSEAVREAFADRIEAILASHISGFSKSVIGRKAFSPADLNRLNINLEGGDPYGGYCGLDQYFVWRPFASSRNHATEIKGLWHIGASTHPGPGLGGGSGFLIAEQLGRR